MRSAESRVRVLKVLLIVFFSFSAFVFLLLRRSAPAGYEVSLLANTPWVAWVVIGSAGIGGLWLLIWQAVGNKAGRGWAWGLVLLVLCNALIVSLWGLRGYMFWFGNDTNAHYGMVSDYLSWGRVTNTNVYPSYHVSLLQIQLVTGMPLTTAFKLAPLMLTITSMLSVVALARFIFRDSPAWLYVTACSAVLLFGLYHIEVYPRGLGQFMITSVVWLYLMMRGRWNFALSAALLLAVISFNFVHPLLMLFLVLFLLLTEVSRAIFEWLEERKDSQRTIPGSHPGNLFVSLPGKLGLSPFLLGAVVYFLWFSRFQAFSDLLVQIKMSITGQRDSDWLAKAIDVLGAVHGWSKVEFLFKIYAANWLMWLLMGVGMLAVVWRWRKGDRSLKPLVMLMPWMVVAELIWIPFFRSVGGSAVIETSVVSSLAAVFAGYALYLWLGRSAKALVARVSVAVAIIGAIALLGTFALYRSPYLFQANPQMILSDVSVTRWVLDKKLPYVEFVGVGLPYSAAFVVLGETAVDYGRPDLNSSVHWSGILKYNEEVIPSHFGYDRYATYGEQFARDKYVILTDRLELTRQDPTLVHRGAVIGPSFGRMDFDDADFAKWQSDPTVDLVYDNGDSQTYLAHGTMYR